MIGNLPPPVKRQREVLYLPETGHSVVLGTAGSGKTTLALYRAAYLSDPTMPHSGLTLILTFTKVLANYLEHLTSNQLRNVHIEHYHKFAWRYLNFRNKIHPNSICCENERKKFITNAVRDTHERNSNSTLFNRPNEFFMDEIKWIFCNGITTSDEYVNVVRSGRNGTNLSKNLRPLMFEILERYVEIRMHAKKIYDWDDIAYYVRREFEKDTSSRKYKHIIVDEGQDFSPEMIRSLKQAIPEDGSLTFFGDVAQQIFNKRTSWREAVLNIPEPWIFKDNYRNSPEITQLGLAILQMPYFKNIHDKVEPKSPPVSGALPTLVKCEDENQQFEQVIKIARDASKSQVVGILLKNKNLEMQYSLRLGSSVKSIKFLDFTEVGPNIYTGYYHTAKGLEFDMVILPYLDSENLPDREQVEIHGIEEASADFGKLLYVAITRAKSNLILLYSKELTTLLPSDEKLYQVVCP